MISKLNQEKTVNTFLLFIIIIQPILDAGVYWLLKSGDTTITTIIRMLILFVFVLYAFIISKRKWRLLLCIGLVGAFWAIHVIIIYRGGYISIFEDTANFIRVFQMPVLAIALLDFFAASDDIKNIFLEGCTINLYLIALITLISFITGSYEYTYAWSKIGVGGWFASSNAHSAILAALYPIALLYSQRQNKKWFFVLTALIGALLLFFIGTRVAYFALIITAVCYIISIFITKCSSKYFYSATLLFLIIASVMAYPVSPIMQRNASYNSMIKYNEDLILQQVDEAIKNDPDIDPNAPPGEIKNNTLKKIAYKYYCSDLINKFGYNETLAAYNNTIDIGTLADVRYKKYIFVKLLSQTQDLPLRLFGSEYSFVSEGTVDFTPEDDFSVLCVYFGIIGTALYTFFLLFFLAIILYHLKKNFKKYFTLELCVAAISIALIFGAAIIAGHVIMRPNVSIYLSLLLAYTYSLTILTPAEGKTDEQI